MQKQIASYLFQNKSCYLPGLGTLYVINSGAEIDFTNKHILSPKAIIQFEEVKTDAAGLLDYLSATTGADQYEVTAAFDHFCDTLTTEINNKPEVALESIGTFFVDGSGKINFKSEELPAAFVQSVFAERVVHPDAEHQILVGDKETTNTEMTELLNEKIATKDRWWIWAIVLGIVGLLVLVVYFTEFKGTSAFGNAINYIHS